MMHTRTLLLTVLTAAFVLSGCQRTPATPTGGRLFIFVDQSASVKPDQKPRWQAEARKLASCIGPGWQITLFGVHDQTLGAPPLFDADIPYLSADAGIDETTTCDNATKSARKGAIGAFETAFNEAGRARQTDLLSAIDRIGGDRSGRPALAVFFSDMINSTYELNMEGGLTGAQKRIPEIAARHRWGPNTLTGVRVYCVLNGLRSGDASGPDLRLRKSFYDSLIRALGGELVLFDTHFDAKHTLLAQGGRHAGN